MLPGLGVLASACDVGLLGLLCLCLVGCCAFVVFGLIVKCLGLCLWHAWAHVGSLGLTWAVVVACFGSAVLTWAVSVPCFGS